MKDAAKKTGTKKTSKTAAGKPVRVRKPKPEPGSFEALMVAIAIAEKTGFGKYVSE